MRLRAACVGVAFLPVCALVWLGCQSAAITAAGPTEAMLAGARCEAAIRERLRDWGADLERAIADPPGVTGLRSARVPTSAVGLWARMVEEGNGEVAIERLTATRTERLRFDQECAPGEYAVATPPRPADAFTDAELITLVSRADRGVILLWSPHMPLSVDQHAVLSAVAKELGLTVLPLLDPAADAGYAARTARERGLPPGALRPLGGIELAFRGMATHTPSLQVFAAGSLVGPVLYGYRNEAVLRQALIEMLATR